jgi:hypothetical protein
MVDFNIEELIQRLEIIFDDIIFKDDFIIQLDIFEKQKKREKKKLKNCLIRDPTF